MNIQCEEETLLGNVILDGKVMIKNLKLLNKTEEWLLHELKVKGYEDTSKIILCTLDTNDKITIYEENENIKSLDILE